MARSPCSAVSPSSLSPAPPLPVRLAIRPRHAHSLSLPAARPLVARSAAAGDKVEADTPIEKRFTAFPTVIDINQILDILLHSNIGEYAVAIKNVSINDDFFQGHFPDRPIMPGVLMVEAMARLEA